MLYEPHDICKPYKGIYKTSKTNYTNINNYYKVRGDGWSPGITKAPRCCRTCPGMKANILLTEDPESSQIGAKKYRK